MHSNRIGMDGMEESNWNLEVLVFVEEGENQRKTLGAGTRTNKKLNPHMETMLGIELALTTAPSQPTVCVVLHFRLLFRY